MTLLEQCYHQNLLNNLSYNTHYNDDLIVFLAFALVHDCFVAAAERQIHVADAINFRIITKAGIEEKAMF